MKKAGAYFQELTQIPRPSGHEEKVRNYLKQWADEHTAEYREDNAGNVLLRRGTPRVTLQAHMDMVAESVEPFDFLTSPLSTYEEDGWLYARGTTLGGDDGAGIALALALLERTDNLECLFTAEEETNMTGALGLEENVLAGKILLNLDHEDVNTILIGCAGGMNTDAFFTPKREPAAGTFYKLSISGLLSGHSGLEIGLNRANAIRLAAAYLQKIPDLKIASFVAGTKPNVIPKEAEVIFSGELSSTDALLETVKKEFPLETTVSVTVEKTETPETVWPKEFSKTFTETLLAVPNGVFVQNERGVETSSNLAIVTTENEKILVATLQRSATDIRPAVNKVTDAFLASGASVISYGNYPGWRLNDDAELLKTAADVYENVFGHAPVIETTHGGVECGVFQEKYPGMQIISVGPTIENVHTVNERMNLQSLDDMEKYLEALLLRLN